MKNSSSKKKISISILVVLMILVIISLILKGCQSKEYKVTFDTNEGNKISEVKVKENQKISKPKTPKKEEYEFIGWYYNDKLFDFNTKINKNIKLEARWKKIGKEVEKVSLDKIVLSMNAGDEAELKVTVTPNDAEDQNLTWTSSDTSIVTVDKNGKIKALKEGKVTITVTSKNGKKSECTVTVTKEETTTTKKATTKNNGSKKTTNKNTTTQKTTQTTTTIKPVEDKYTLVITKLVTQDGKTYQYRLGSASKNGSTFNDYVIVEINGSYYKKGINIDGDIAVPAMVGLVKNGSIIARATVVWHTETVQ